MVPVWIPEWEPEWEEEEEETEDGDGGGNDDWDGEGKGEEALEVGSEGCRPGWSGFPLIFIFFEELSRPGLENGCIDADSAASSAENWPLSTSSGLFSVLFCFRDIK